MEKSQNVRTKNAFTPKKNNHNYTYIYIFKLYLKLKLHIF